MGQDWEVVSRMWGRNVRGLAGSGVGVGGGQQELKQECEWISCKWFRSVKGSAIIGAGM